MKEATHYRKGKTILDADGNVVETFKHYNKAKRKSRELQMAADGALGRGTVRLRAHKPKAKNYLLAIREHFINKDLDRRGPRKRRK